MVNHQAIACPSEPWPKLAMPEVTIYGLDNVWPLANPEVTQPGSGYHAVITLQFGYYNGQDGLPKLSQLQLQGQYSLTQCLCSAAATRDGDAPPTACDNWVKAEEIHGVGNFTSTLTNVFVDVMVDIQITGTASGRTLQVIVDKLTLRGSQVGALPDLSIDDLTVETTWTWMSKNIWLPQAKRALESEDGRQGIIENLNAALNKPENRDQLTDMLTRQLNKAIDDTLGMVPPGMLPSEAGQQSSNPVDQYLFDRLRFALNDPTSTYYLPRVIYNSTDPQLEPFQIERIALGNQTYEGIELENLQFTQIQITGLSNIRAPADQLIFKTEVVDAALALSTLNPPPQVTINRNGSSMIEQVPNPPLTIVGQFSMNIVGSSDSLGGSFTMKINGANVFASATSSGEELDELRIDFQKLQLAAPLNAASIDVAIDSAFKDIVNQILNQDPTKSKALQGVNDKAEQSLDKISQEATVHVRKLVASKLGG
jgi:hypothetical protein